MNQATREVDENSINILSLIDVRQGNLGKQILSNGGILSYSGNAYGIHIGKVELMMVKSTKNISWSGAYQPYNHRI